MYWTWPLNIEREKKEKGKERRDRGESEKKWIHDCISKLYPSGMKDALLSLNEVDRKTLLKFRLWRLKYMKLDLNSPFEKRNISFISPLKSMPDIIPSLKIKNNLVSVM